jgi:hypothetical protein
MKTLLRNAFFTLARTRRHSFGHLLHRVVEADIKRQEIPPEMRIIALPENTQQTAKNYVGLTTNRWNRCAAAGNDGTCRAG